MLKIISGCEDVQHKIMSVAIANKAEIIYYKYSRRAERIGSMRRPGTSRHFRRKRYSTHRNSTSSLATSLLETDQGRQGAGPPRPPAVRAEAAVALRAFQSSFKSEQIGLLKKSIKTCITHRKQKLEDGNPSIEVYRVQVSITQGDFLYSEAKLLEKKSEHSTTAIQTL